MGVVHQCDTCVHDLGEVVWWNVGRHAHGDAIGAVYQQVRNLGRKDNWLDGCVVEVGDEIDGVFVNVGQQLFGDLGHAGFGVTVGRRGITVDRAKVPLAVD